MACNTSLFPPSVTKGTAQISEYTSYSKSGNDVYNIPVYQGEPLSAACQRTTTMGNIPEVYNYPGFTVVNGVLETKRTPMAGIASGELRNFFGRRMSGCFGDVPYYGTVCCDE